MAETINIGDSYYKDIDVTYESDGEIEPVDLSIYDDNYVAVKKDRSTPDDDSYIFKAVPVKGSPEDGTLVLNLSPHETSMLPLMSDNLPFINIFIQIGSTVTGQSHEVASFRVKTRQGGVHHITEVDKSYGMGRLTEAVGWVFDAGKLCEPTTSIIDFDPENGGLLLYDAGWLGASEIDILDPGRLDLNMPEVIDLGYIRECTQILNP